MHITPKELQQKFTPDDLPGQYLLSRDRSALPDGWPTFDQDGWYLASHSRLPCLRLTAADGSAAGFLLGYAITPDGALLVDADQPVTVPDGDAFAPWVDQLSGRYLVIRLTADEQRVYPDPSCSLAAVYCPSLELVATTPGLIPYTPETEDRLELMRQMPLPDITTCFPVGMTPRFGIWRLLANHTLDLQAWDTRREWPRSDMPSVADPERASLEVGEIVKRNIAAVGARYGLQMSITAGRDSRTMLACAKALAPDIVFRTSILPGEPAMQDVKIGEQIARDCNLNHIVVPYEEPSQDEKDLWLFRTAFAVGNKLSYLGMRTAKTWDNDRPYLTGFISEAARGCYATALNRMNPAWRQEGITPEQLLQLSKVPADDETLARTRNWLAGQPLTDPEHIASLFYHEQIVSSWIAVLAPAFADTNAFELWPLNSRTAVATMLTLPHEFRIKAEMNNVIIEKEWPELAAYPFNPTTKKKKKGLRTRIKKAVRRLVGS